MANKAKVKCAVCHKPFKTAKANQLICDDCERKRRQMKPAATTKPVSAATVAPTAGKPSWLTQATTHTIAPPDVPPPTPIAPRRPQPGIARQTPPPKPAPQPQRPPRVRVPRSPTQPFTPTPEQVVIVERRYRELAQPEFDGIRTQIAHEMSIPKRAVREIVAALRAREHLPSWWELQQFNGTPEDLARIRAAYTPFLPAAPLGIHKQIAQSLNLTPTQVYYGIRQVRHELGLPDYNPPESHPEAPQLTVSRA